MRNQDEYMRRLHWRCRRGLLELDIVLASFIQAKYSQLSADEQQVFDEILDVPDNVLWDMITGKQAVENKQQQVLLAKIQAI